MQVSYKETLTNEQQYYSLIVSGWSLADFNGNGLVDFEDLARLSDYWLRDEPPIDIAPAGGDGIINFRDFAKFAEGRNQ